MFGLPDPLYYSFHCMFTRKVITVRVGAGVLLLRMSVRDKANSTPRRAIMVQYVQQVRVAWHPSLASISGHHYLNVDS